MDRIAESLKSKIMSAEEAAKMIKSGMTIGVSGFTNIGYPKAVPTALAESKHAKDLTIMVGAATGDELDGALVRAGLVKYRYGISRMIRFARRSMTAVFYSAIYIFPSFR